MRRGGSPQRFCGAACKKMYWSAVRVRRQCGRDNCQAIRARARGSIPSRAGIKLFPATSMVSFSGRIGAHARDELGFAPNQNPVFVEVTSDADWATGIAFPAGRLVNTTFESFTSDEERREAMSSLGHHPHAAGRHSLAMLDARAQPHIVSSSVALTAPMQRREEHRSWSFPRAGAASVARSATKSQVHRQLYMPAIAPSASDNQGRRSRWPLLFHRSIFVLRKVSRRCSLGGPVP